MSNEIKLSFTKAKQIRALYEQLRVDQSHAEATGYLATMFGVHRRSIDRVIANEAWFYRGGVNG